MTKRLNSRFAIVVVMAMFFAWLVPFMAGTASAATGHVEAEGSSCSTTSGTWSGESASGASGGTAIYSGGTNPVRSCSVSVTSGQVAQIRIGTYGGQSYVVSLDGATGVTLSAGCSAGSWCVGGVLTSSLAAGTHTVAVSPVSGGGVDFDYIDVVESTPSTTTTTTAPTTTTTAPPAIVETCYVSLMSVNGSGGTINRIYASCVRADAAGVAANFIFGMSWSGNSLGSSSWGTTVIDTTHAHLIYPNTGGNLGAATQITPTLNCGATVTCTAIAAGDGYPNFPDGFGSVSAPTVLPTCSRILAQNQGNNVATFTAAPSAAPANTSLASSWNFGDASATTTQLTPQHIYAAITSQPQGGWTATFTATYTTGSGLTFPDGTTVKTLTCSLRVDFLNPNSTGATTTTNDDNSSCGSTLNLLFNPLSLVCILIPDSAHMSSMGTMWGDMTGRAPFSYGYEVVTFIPDSINNIRSQGNDQARIEICPHVFGTPTSGGSADYMHLPGAGADDANGVNTNLHNSDEMCSSSFKGNFTNFQRVAFVMFVIGMAICLYHFVMWCVS